jgi:predicted transcriptional regulator
MAHPMSALNRLLCGAGTCEDLLSCVYNLNKLESETYFALLAGPARMDELAGALRRERSTVYRALQKLVGLQLAMRDTVSLDGGGYCHVYAPVHPDAVARRVEQWRDEFSRTLTVALRSFVVEVERRQAQTGRASGALRVEASAADEPRA